MLLSAPASWTRRIHPLGNVYCHKIHQGQVYITQSHITEPSSLKLVDELIHEMERLILLRQNLLSDHILVYLQPGYQGGSECGYCLINNAPESLRVFSLHDFNVAEDPKVGSVDGPSGLGACQHDAIRLISRS